MSRPRPQLTNAEVVKFLNKFPKDMPIYCSVSEINVDEPVETQEFILHEGRKKCVAVDCNTKSITFGFDNGS